MCRSHKISVYAVLLLISALIGLTKAGANPQDAYSEGLTLRESEDWEEALKVWWSVYIDLEAQGNVDPRIGVAFIETATENEADQYYGTASRIYLWGFSKEDLQFSEAILDEAKRMAPLQGWDEKEEWEWKIKKKKAKGFAQSIREYWAGRDPRPATEGNERLIEHWERIAYARKTFTRNTFGEYDCDDRGTIYIKYGEPDRKHSGRFGSSAASNMEMMMWISGSIALRELKALDYTPEYEVWAYDHIGTEESSIFLFSNRDGIGAFGLVSGIESLYRKTRDIYTSILEGGAGRLVQPRDYLVYQIMYYAELIPFDRFFQKRYDRLRHIWENQNMGSGRFRQTGRAFLRLLHNIEMENKFQDEFNPIVKYADTDKSDFESAMGDIKVAAYPVRILDDDVPKLALYASCSPEFLYRDLETKEASVQVPPYNLHQMLITRDRDIIENGRMQESLSLGEGMPSLFMVEHDSKIAQATLGAEAVDMAGSIMAIGRKSFDVLPPLDDRSDRLELSDLVLGISVPNLELTTDLPFPVIPVSEFSRNDPLKLAIEMYHLYVDDQGLCNVTIEYGVTKMKGKKKEEQIGLVYRIQPRGRTSKEELSVDISKLKPGDYEFFVKVRDEISRNEKTRTTEFEVIKE